MKSLLAKIKKWVKGIPLLGPLARQLSLAYRKRRFKGSSDYWIERYKKGGNSGEGSYNKFAVFKAEVINAFVEKNVVNYVIEFGCGDGNQLKYMKYPMYTGVDISPEAVTLCRKAFSGDSAKRFMLLEDYDGATAELSLSLDVIYHLVEDEVFSAYMELLFSASSKYVIIYSSNQDSQDDNQIPYVRHRLFTEWIEENKPDWKLINHIHNRYSRSEFGEDGSQADFFIYQKVV